MKLTKLAQLAAVGITISAGLMPLDAEARGRKGGGGGRCPIQLEEGYAPETDYSGYSSEQILTAIEGLEDELEEDHDEISEHREEGRALRTSIKEKKAAIEATADVVEQAALQTELDELLAEREEHKEERDEFREARYSIKKEIKYLKNLSATEESAEEESATL